MGSGVQYKKLPHIRITANFRISSVFLKQYAFADENVRVFSDLFEHSTA
jgi:hypothetical protein